MGEPHLWEVCGSQGAQKKCSECTCSTSNWIWKESRVCAGLLPYDLLEGCKDNTSFVMKDQGSKAFLKSDGMLALIAQNDIFELECS